MLYIADALSVVGVADGSVVIVAIVVSVVIVAVLLSTWLAEEAQTATSFLLVYMSCYVGLCGGCP